MARLFNFFTVMPAAILMSAGCASGNGSDGATSNPVDSGPTSAEVACGAIEDIDELYNYSSEDFDDWWSSSVSTSARLAGVMTTWQEDDNSDLYVEASEVSRDFSSILGFLEQAPTTVEDSDRFIELTEEFPGDLAAALELCRAEGF